MGAMTDWYKKYQMGIVDEDTFDLEEEYQSYNEDLFNTAYRVKKGINFIKHRNSEDRKNANRRDAAKLGIMKGNFREKIGNALADSHRRELYRGGDVVKSGAGMLAAGEYARNGRRFKNRMEKSYKRYDEKINEESFDLMDEYESLQ